MGGGVAQDRAPLVGVGVEGFDLRAVRHGSVEVPRGAVDLGGDDLTAHGVEGLERLDR